MPTAPSCPTTLYHNSSSRSTKRPLDLGRREERRAALAFSLVLSARLYSCTPIHGTSDRLSPSYRTVFSSLPLRLVPEGNKDGSAYVQPATGGGARLPSVGRTNANDSSMQDGVGIQPRGAVVWCGAREVLLYLACDVQRKREREREKERETGRWMHRTACNSRPPGVSVDRLVYTLDHLAIRWPLECPSSAYRPQIPTRDDALWDVRFTVHARLRFSFRKRRGSSEWDG